MLIIFLPSLVPGGEFADIVRKYCKLRLQIFVQFRHGLFDR